MAAPLPWKHIDPLLRQALKEDLGRGDVTGEACIPARAMATGRVVAKQAGVVAGLPVAKRVFQRVGRDTRFTVKVADGRRVRPGATLAVVRGRTRALLAAERTALNLLGHMSGVATLTRAYADAAGRGRTQILDTRKTIPLWRPLQRYAVRMGGGANHRYNLASAAMIKTNHIRLAGGETRLTDMVADCRRRAPRGSEVVVEAASIDEFRAAMEAGADVVMCDNMTNAQITRCLALRPGRRPLVEVSGGITLKRVPALARLGADRISVGAITHSAPQFDVALRLEPV